MSGRRTTSPAASAEATLASAARQPTEPQRQTRPPGSALTRMWPMSPAPPSWPAHTRPSSTMPAPMPVETLRKTRASSSGYSATYSPSAIAFASFSTSTGRSRERWKCPAMSKSCQPDMMGGSLRRPLAGSTGPGTDRPMPMADEASRPVSASTERMLVSSTSRVWAGSGEISTEISLVTSTARPRSTTPTQARSVFRAAVSTTPASGSNSSCRGRRPPVESARPRSRRNPDASSDSTR